LQRVISPERGDAYDGKTPARSYKDIMLAQELRKEEAEVRKAIAKQTDKDNGQVYIYIYIYIYMYRNICT
jgi:hypothetical protein